MDYMLNFQKKKRNEVANNTEKGNDFGQMVVFILIISAVLIGLLLFR
ncbi:hypothetical protein [Pedobacter sp. GSP4]